MDALKIGFETVIVGALALPWIFLVIDLFCPSHESLLDGLLDRLKDQTLSAGAGILLFALAYLLGSSVGRVAEDFLKDEDPGLHLTEDTIRTAVYCNPRSPWLIETGGVLVDPDSKTPMIELCKEAEKRNESQKGDPGSVHNNGVSNHEEQESERLEREYTENKVRQTFALQESTLLSGADTPDRVRYQHQQIIVLRGVFLDCAILSMLCFFGLCAARGNAGRATLGVFSSALFIWAIYLTWKHVERLYRHGLMFVGEPPLLEMFLFTIAIAGIGLAIKANVQRRSFGCGLIFSTLLTVMAFSGWWYGEIVYNQTVLYFFAAHAMAHAK